MTEHTSREAIRQRLLPIAGVSIALGLIFDWLFYGKLPGISVFIYTALALGGLVYFAWQFKKPLNSSIFWLSPITLFFSLMVFIRANAFLAFINVLLVMYLLTLVVRLAQAPNNILQRYDIPEYFGLIVDIPLGIIREFFQSLGRLMATRSTSASKSSLTPVVRGIALSLPVLAIFLLLLSSADMVFKDYVSTIFNPSLSPETIFRLSLIGFVSSLFIGAYALIFTHDDLSESAALAGARKIGLGATESSIILGSVSTLFLLFVLIQLAYLFGGQGHIAATGHTYADYARKGFFELIAVAAISLALLLTIKRTTVFRTLSQDMLFKFMSSVLIVEVMVIVASAHMRLNLYEEAYGFTTLRLWSHLFILWLVVAFILLLVHIIRGKGEHKLAFQLFVSVLCFFAVINIVNPDAFIARQNIQRFRDTGKLDAGYLGGLSEDATPQIVKLRDLHSKDARKTATDILSQQQRYAANQRDHWQSTNLAADRAQDIFSSEDK